MKHNKTYISKKGRFIKSEKPILILVLFLIAEYEIIKYGLPESTAETLINFLYYPQFIALWGLIFYSIFFVREVTLQTNGDIEILIFRRRKVIKKSGLVKAIEVIQFFPLTVYYYGKSSFFIITNFHFDEYDEIIELLDSVNVPDSEEIKGIEVVELDDLK